MEVTEMKEVRLPAAVLAVGLAFAAPAVPAFADAAGTTNDQSTTTSQTTVDQTTITDQTTGQATTNGSATTVTTAPDATIVQTTSPATTAPITVTGRVAGLNFPNGSFWVNTPTGNFPVVAGAAPISFKGQNANIYRMMGGPQVTVTGPMTGNLLYASSIRINTGPSERLQQSAYTDQAVPPFSSDQLAPVRYGAGTGTNSAAMVNTTVNNTTVGNNGGYGYAGSSGYATQRGSGYHSTRTTSGISYFTYSGHRYALGQSRTVQGRVAGLNLRTKTFSVVHGGSTTSVLAQGATIRINGKYANINRLMGSPYVQVSGRQTRGAQALLAASTINILSGPTPTLASSSYTRHAWPPMHLRGHNGR
jgi:hypothetical protein